jgi:hypothetical protein
LLKENPTIRMKDFFSYAINPKRALKGPFLITLEKKAFSNQPSKKDF